MSILDVGCGSNPSGDVNCDVSTYYVNVKATSNFIICSAMNLPFIDKSFDTVFTSHVIEHVTDPLLMFKELYRVSSKEILVRCPHKDGSGAHMPGHLTFFDFNWFYMRAEEYNLDCRCHNRVFDSVVPITPRKIIPKKLSSNFIVKKYLGFFRSYLNPNAVIKEQARTPFEIEAKFAKQQKASN